MRGGGKGEEAEEVGGVRRRKNEGGKTRDGLTFAKLGDGERKKKEKREQDKE